MMNNKSRFFLKAALFSAVVLAFPLSGAFLASAYENSTDQNGTAVESAENESGTRKAPWIRARDLSQERKMQIEADSEKKRALMREGDDESRQAKMREKSGKQGQNLCANLVERNTKVSERLGEMQENILRRKDSRVNVFDENRETRDATLKEKRGERDTKRAEMYAKLLEKAGSDTAKQAAVATFKTAVEQAVVDRKQSVDAAIAAFRTGVDAAIGTRKGSIDTSLSSFKAAADAAFATAKSSCEAGDDPKSVRETLQTSLKSARTSVQSDRQAADKVGEQVKALAETKKSAFATALADFKSAIETARAVLKEAFETIGE